MAEPPPVPPGLQTAELGASAKTGLDWARLFAQRSADGALEEIGRWLSPAVTALTLDSGSARLVCWPTQGAEDASLRLTTTVEGSPPWQLALAFADDQREPRPSAVERASLALAAWRAARESAARAEQHLAARSRELDLLSALGRRAAEAHDVCSLFAGAASVLAPGLELDLTLAAWRDESELAVEIHATRPCTDPCVTHLAERARLFLGAGEHEQVRVRLRRLEGWDAGRGALEDPREEDVTLLPLLRRDVPAACLIAVDRSRVSESQLRPLYGAASQLSLHLDRILSMREAEADRFRKIVDSMPQGVVLLDTGLRPILENRSACRLCESIELGAEQLVPWLAERGLGDGASRVAAGQSGSWEGEIHPAADRTWSVTVSAFARARRGIEGIVLVLDDVTERRRMQDRLAQAEKMSSLGQMISGVAHELNNPLASILGYAQLLRLKGADERLPERLETLSREAERCRKIVQSLLSFARSRPAEHRALSVNAVVRNVVSLLEYQLRVDDVTVSVELHPDLPTMHGDAHQLEQMLVNLLTNARHAIRDSGRPGNVFIRTAPDLPRGLLLEVEDDGPGIPAELRERIFDPFFTTKRAGQGTGLGLALVYSIVSAHGGTIELREREGGDGASFRLQLPLGEAAAALTAATARQVEAPPVRRGRILVVDDEEALARLICDALEHDGHVASRVSDGRQALARLAEEEFDLIVSDVRMPGLRADRLLEELRRLSPRLARRMLLTSGDTLGPSIQELAARTGLDVLPKPFDLAELRRSVHAQLARED